MDTFSHLVPWVISCWILYCSAQPLIIQPTFFYSIVHLNGHPQNILVTLPHLGTCLREPVSFERNPSALQDSNTTSSGESNISFFIRALYSNQSQSSFHPHTTNRAATCSKAGVAPFQPVWSFQDTVRSQALTAGWHGVYMIRPDPHQRILEYFRSETWVKSKCFRKVRKWLKACISSYGQSQSWVQIYTIWESN